MWKIHGPRRKPHSLSHPKHTSRRDRQPIIRLHEVNIKRIHILQKFHLHSNTCNTASRFQILHVFFILIKKAVRGNVNVIVLLNI